MPKTIHQSVKLPAAADRLYDMYLDPMLHSAFTGGQVTINPVVGSEFNAFEGMLTGRVLALSPKRLIVQSWRGKDWKSEDADSVLVLSFLPEGDACRIELVHVNVPDYEFEDIYQGWEKYYWKPWREYLEKEKAWAPKAA